MAKRLTPLQSRFIYCYLANGGNGTRAARTAGYKGDDHTLAQIAYENLRKPEIRAVLDARMKELAMGPDEIIYRLTQQGRGDIRDLIGLTPDQIKQHPMGALVKEFEHTVDRIDDVLIQEKIKVKLYSKYDALVQLGKLHKLFTERIEVDWSTELKSLGLDPAEVESELVQQFEQLIRARAAKAAAPRPSDG